MTKEKYQELTEQMLNEYCSLWPDWDITIPSFEQAQEQELLLESKGETKVKVKSKNTKIDIDKEFAAAFGAPRREMLDEKIYWEEDEAEKIRKKELENFTLTESQKTLLDEACGEKEVTDHSLDSAFEEAFGSGRSAERLQELEESIGSDSEGRILLESATVDFCDSNGGKPFKFGGRAFKVDHINKNNRRYPRSLVEGALRAAKARTLSCMSGHPSPGATDPSLVVGRITLGEIDSDNWVRYNGTLSETRKGKDLQILLRDKNIGDVSLRSRGKTSSVTVDGESIYEVTSLAVKGLDLVIEGSFVGAKADEIFNALET